MTKNSSRAPMFSLGLQQFVAVVNKEKVEVKKNFARKVNSFILVYFLYILFGGDSDPSLAITLTMVYEIYAF